MLRIALNSIYFYFLLPAYTAICLLLIFFNVPTFFYPGILAYGLIITFPILAYTTLNTSQLPLLESYQKLTISSTHRFIIFAFCGFIFLCGPLDIYFNGFKLFNPAYYAETPGIGRYIRHFTILTWIFIPVAFIYCKNSSLKFSLISYALIFPIIIIDRNRILLSFYTFLFLSVLNQKEKSNPSQKMKWLFGLLLIFVMFIFAIIGKYRSGNALIVPSSGKELIFYHYPLKSLYLELPLVFQQVILYVATPLFNFISVVSSHFTNPDFLLSQFSPFSRESFEHYPFAPIWVTRFNVGTELYPFVLYGGLSLAFFAYLGIVSTFLLMFKLFKKYPNIFTLLIIVKLTYLALFLGFAPQFYILFNAMFLLIMLTLWFGAELLTKLAFFRRSFWWNLVS